MKTLRRRFFSLMLTGAALALASPAFAQDWPAKPVTIIVGYPAGGDTDAAARLYAERLSSRFGQTFLVENKPGASGAIGASFVAKASPDGYTLLYVPSTFTIVPHVLKLAPSVAYDVRADFTPIIKDQNIPMVMMTGSASGIRSLADLVQQAKAGKVQNYASPGAGTPMQVLAEMFNRAAGLKLTHVPYKGTAPLVVDLLGGHASVGWVTPGIVAPHMQSGKLVALATGETQRSSLMPNVPTFAESSYPSVQLSAWQGLVGPRGLSPAMVAKLNGAINEILIQPEVRARMGALGMEAVGGPPSALAAQIDADTALFSRLIKEYGIRAD